MKKNSFFYFIMSNEYFICDLDMCQKSERSFDMSLFELANNQKLLDKLALYYMAGNYGVRYTFESRAEWFCGYLATFSNNFNDQYQKSLTNPIIRLFIENDTLLQEIKTILS